MRTLGLGGFSARVPEDAVAITRLSKSVKAKITLHLFKQASESLFMELSQTIASSQFRLEIFGLPKTASPMGVSSASLKEERCKPREIRNFCRKRNPHCESGDEEPTR